MLTCTLSGYFNFRCSTLYCSIEMEYNRDGYLNVVSMKAGINQRSELRPVSDRLQDKFQDENWNALYGMCIDYDNRQAEIYRDERIDNMRECPI